MTDDEFDRCMAVLIAGVGKAMPREQVDVWRDLLGDMTFDELKRGIVACLRHYKFAGFPSAGLIREAAGLTGGVMDADAMAVTAWDKVRRAIRTEGAYKSVEWDDPAIPLAINAVAGSWVKLCDQTSEELTVYTGKKFQEAYKANRTARAIGKTTSPGLIAVEAGRLGYEAPEPLRIGCEPEGVYGFNRETVKALPGPVAELAARLAAERVDKPEPQPVEVAPTDGQLADIAVRKAADIEAMKVKFGNVQPVLKAVEGVA